MMIFLKLVKFSFLLISLIAFLILLPAFLFDSLTRWQIIVLALSCFVFFLPTVWRSLPQLLSIKLLLEL
jgi:hypothetical protein